MFAEIPPDKLVYALPLLLLPILPNLWGIVHVYRREFPTPQERAAWLVALIVLPVIGGLMYMLLGARRATKKNLSPLRAAQSRSLMKIHSLRRKILLAGTLAAMGMLSACASTSDVNQLRSQLYYQEQERAKQQERVTQLEAGLAQTQPAQANSWAEINALRSEVASISGQMDDLRRAQTSQSGMTLDTLNTRMQDLDRKIMFMASQLGVVFEEFPQSSGAPASSQTSPARTEPAPATPSFGASAPMSPEEPEIAQRELYQKALEQFYATNYKQAQTMWAEFVKGFPKDSLVPNALFWQGECFFQMQDYANAVLTYQKVIESHSKSSKYKAAMLKQGIAFYKLKKEQAGKLVLQDLVKKYPDSAEGKRAQAYLKGGGN